MRIVHQYQPNGGSPAHERDVFWLTPKNEEQKRDLDRLTRLLKDNGINAGWCKYEDIVLIDFPAVKKDE